MNCPQCGKEMNNESYWYSGFAGWDDDYPSSYYELYVCKNCNHRYTINWSNPKNPRPVYTNYKILKSLYGIK